MFRILLMMFLFYASLAHAQRFLLHVGDYDAWNIEIADGRMYIASSFDGIHVLDIINPLKLVKTHSFIGGSGYVFDVMIRNDIAYVINWDYGGFQAYDVSRPGSFPLLGDYYCSGRSNDMAINGGILYVPGLSNMNYIYDVSDIKNAVLIDSNTEFSTSVTISGNLMYSGGSIFNTTDPADIYQIGSFATPGSDIDVKGRYLYVANGNTGLLIYDCIDPSAPNQVGRLKTIGHAQSISVVDNLAFIVCNGNATENKGLEIIDVSNPASPSRVGQCSQWDFFPYGDVIVKENLVYMSNIGWNTGGIDIIDISDILYGMSVNANSTNSSIDIQCQMDRMLPTVNDSVGILIKRNGAPYSRYDTSASCVGIFASQNFVQIPFKIDIDSTYYVSCYIKYQDGTWDDDFTVLTIADMLYDYSTDSVVLDSIIRLNNLDIGSIDEIADTLKGAVKTLFLDSLGLTKLPANFGDLQCLNELYLQDNDIVSLPQSVLALDQLVSVDFSRNRFELFGPVKNWALGLDEDYQLNQINIRNHLYVNLRDRTGRKNGFIQEAVLVIEPKGDVVKHDLFVTYSDKNARPGFDDLEINHHFHLDEDEWITDLWLWMGDSVMQAKMYDLGRAQQIYDSIVRPPVIPEVKIDPAFLTKDGNHYELSIFPYVSGDGTRIKLTYFTPVLLNDGVALSEVPIQFLNQDNNIIKPLEVLFKNKLDIKGRMPAFVETTEVQFYSSIDTLGYRYLSAHINDITYFPELTIEYSADPLDADSAVDALINANTNINYLVSLDPVDIASVVDSSIRYNILTDYTALLALEPDATNHFMPDPLDETIFVVDIDNTEPASLLESIGFKIDPNPFSTHTNIMFSLEQASSVRFEIYSPAGTLLKSVHNGALPAGQQRLRWDGRTDAGASLEKGTYIFMIEIDGKAECGKVMKF